MTAISPQNDTIIDIPITNSEDSYFQSCVPDCIDCDLITDIALNIIIFSGLALWITTDLSFFVIVPGILIASSLVNLLKNCLTDQISVMDTLQEERYENTTPEQLTNSREERLNTYLSRYPLQTGINDQHIRHSLSFETAEITAPDGCDFDTINIFTILDLFDQMNTTVQYETNSDGSLVGRRDYVDPTPGATVIMGDDAFGNPLSIDHSTARDKIERVLNAVQTGYNDATRNNDAEKIQFYDKLIKSLKINIFEIRKDTHPSEITNDIILHIATAEGHCNGRYVQEILEGPERLITSQMFTSFDDIVLEEFHQLRKNLAQELTRRHPRSHGLYIPHVLQSHMVNLSLARGIRGGEILAFDDVHEVPISQRESITAFDRLYTRNYIIAQMLDMVNGFESTDPAVFHRVGRKFSDDQTNSWFTNHMPENFVPDTPTTENEITQYLTDTNQQLREEGRPPISQEQARERLLKQAYLVEHVYDDSYLIKRNAVIRMLTNLGILQSTF
ncbi:MAG: hypothetical protein KAR79_05040 [Simkaniaceae bacterium]|nr:hypothetical protein [Simkaniaceae bacterium]